jgi:hypothetical protein
MGFTCKAGEKEVKDGGAGLPFVAMDALGNHSIRTTGIDRRNLAMMQNYTPLTDRGEAFWNTFHQKKWSL